MIALKMEVKDTNKHIYPPPYNTKVDNTDYIEREIEYIVDHNSSSDDSSV